VRLFVHRVALFAASDFMRCNFVPIGLAGALATTLCACAGPKIAGNEIGGVVPLTGITQDQAVSMAQGHCAAFGRKARTLGVRNEEGGQLVFECV
jgi:hypothetical protein